MLPCEPRIVLIEPAHPGNIGAAARAMKAMSLSRLVLVRPRLFPALEAERRAKGAIDILQRAVVVDDLDEAIGPCNLVVGCSARARTVAHSVLDARECAGRILREGACGTETAVLFGPERTGLANKDLDRCTYQVLIPTSEEFSSLNLASAVQLICYEIFMAARSDRLEPREVTPQGGVQSSRETRDRVPDHSEMEYFHQHLERALDSRGYLDGDMREVTLVKLRRIFGRARPNLGELKMLHALARFIHRDGD